jgi:hypothetical protein
VHNPDSYAKDRGCSFPNCDAPGYFTEVQHVTPWAKTDDDFPVAVPLTMVAAAPIRARVHSRN